MSAQPFVGESATSNVTSRPTEHLNSAIQCDPIHIFTRYEVFLGVYVATDED